MERLVIQRPLHLACTLVAVFTLSTALLLWLIPGPRSHVDYMIIGTMPALLTMLVLWAWLAGISPLDIFRRHR